MQIENGKVGGLTVDDVFVLNGMATGLITVVDGGDLALTGMALAGVHVEAGGRAKIAGTAKFVRNEGSVEIAGVVDEPLIEAEGAETFVHSGAVIAGRREP